MLSIATEKIDELGLDNLLFAFNVLDDVEYDTLFTKSHISLDDKTKSFSMNVDVETIREADLA